MSDNAEMPILIIDDDSGQLKTLSDIFELEGLQPICCQTGQEALEALQTQQVNVAVLDLRLQDDDGLRLLKALREQNPEIKVIINTAYASLESAITAINRDAFAYVQKMGNVEELLAHVHRAFHVHLASYSEALEDEVRNRTEELLQANEELKIEITQRKRTEEALRDSEERYRLLVEGAQVGIALYDLEDRLLLINARGADNLGGTPKDFIGKTLPEFLDPPTAEFVHKRLQGVITTGEPAQVEDTFELTGRELSFLSVLQPVTDAAGVVVGVQILSHDITERTQVEKALRKSEARYRRIFQTVDVSIWEEDFSAVKAAIDGVKERGVKDFPTYLDEHPEFVEQAVGLVKILDVNDETLKMYGAQNKEEFLTSLARIFVPESLNVFRDELIAIAEGKSIFEAEAVTQTLQGERVDILLKLGIPTAEDAFGNVLVSMMDITKRKQTEEQIKASLIEKEMLLKEIHHRVKNNLQIVSSLLDLQIDHIKSKRAIDALKQSMNRIQSMAYIHEHLYRSENMTQIDIESYLQDLTGHLLYTYGIDPQTIELEINVNDVLLDIDTAIPCGLLVHELASNALKHAFPNGAQGKITIALERSDSEYVLVVADTGVGFPEDIDFRDTASLGLQLAVTLTDQLDGSIELDRSKGTEFRIRFPVTSKE